jgi:two-component system cell cycle sensor histidine kinase/response regulator CckA
VRSGEVTPLGAPSASWLGVPLQTQQRTVGVLVAQSYDPSVRFSEHDQGILEFVSTQVARAIERKQAEDSLRQSERRFRALIENSADGIAVIGADGVMTYRSVSGARVMGKDPGAPLTSMRETVHPDERAVVEEVWARVLANPGVPVHTVGRALHHDGSWRTLESTFVNLLEDKALNGVVANFRDITERKHIEGQLMAADRMVSIGTMAAGVAHEINNPLAYVVANLSLLADALGTSGTEATDLLAAAREGADRVRQIVRNLKTFSRADESVQGDIDIHRVLDSVASLSWNEIRHRARLVKDYGQALPPVGGNEGRLGQVFLNLVVNAAQAMPEGEAGKNEIRLLTRYDGDRVIVEVRDTGAGIKAEHLDHLFDPFFTTKPVGVGTGLGLFICKNIVTSLGGSITVQSQIGRGTVFTVCLPRGSGLAIAAPPAPEPAPAARRARILAVDDEPQMGRVIAAALRAHDVTAITNAADALARLRAGERFDIILCDLMMPQMTGMDLFETLERELPEQARRFVFLTGGAFTPKSRTFLERVKNLRIDKPFEVSGLRAMVAERLREPAEAQPGPAQPALSQQALRLITA